MFVLGNISGDSINWAASVANVTYSMQLQMKPSDAYAEKFGWMFAYDVAETYVVGHSADVWILLDALAQQLIDERTTGTQPAGRMSDVRGCDDWSSSPPLVGSCALYGIMLIATLTLM